MSVRDLIPLLADPDSRLGALHELQSRLLSIAEPHPSLQAIVEPLVRVLSDVHADPYGGNETSIMCVRALQQLVDVDTSAKRALALPSTLAVVKAQLGALSDMDTGEALVKLLSSVAETYPQSVLRSGVVAPACRVGEFLPQSARKPLQSLVSATLNAAMAREDAALVLDSAQSSVHDVRSAYDFRVDRSAAASSSSSSSSSGSGSAAAPAIAPVPVPSRVSSSAGSTGVSASTASSSTAAGSMRLIVNAATHSSIDPATADAYAWALARFVSNQCAAAEGHWLQWRDRYKGATPSGSRASTSSGRRPDGGHAASASAPAPSPAAVAPAAPSTDASLQAMPVPANWPFQACVHVCRMGVLQVWCVCLAAHCAAAVSAAQAASASSSSSSSSSASSTAARSRPIAGAGALLSRGTVRALLRAATRLLLVLRHDQVLAAKRETRTPFRRPTAAAVTAGPSSASAISSATTAPAAPPKFADVIDDLCRNYGLLLILQQIMQLAGRGGSTGTGSGGSASGGGSGGSASALTAAPTATGTAAPASDSLLGAGADSGSQEADAEVLEDCLQLASVVMPA
jgi:hypothetical protein